MLSSFGFSGDLGHGVSFLGFDALVFLYVGFFVGWIAAKLVPSLIPAGLWIWILPVAILSIGLFHAVVYHNFTGYFEDFYVTGANEGLGVIFVTIPALASAGYSAGMVMVLYDRRNRPLRMGRRLLTFALVWTSSLALGVALIPGVASKVVARDRNLQMVARPEGAVLWATPGPLCSGSRNQMERPYITLQNGTWLHSLQRAKCGPQYGDQSRLPAASSQPELAIEHVRILQGSHEGEEGWILASEVWRPLAMLP